MRTAKKTSERRLGRVDSATSQAMLDAAEAILCEEGNAKLTSRRIAERVGVQQRLVFYYFQSVDDLVVEAFRRLSSREMRRLRDATASEKPAREIWDASVHTLDPRLISEFMALAHHLEPLRTEVVDFIEEARRLQVEVLSEIFGERQAASPLPPVVLAILGTSVALALSRETQLGIKTGHAEVEEVLAKFLLSLENGQGASSKRLPGWTGQQEPTQPARKVRQTRRRLGRIRSRR